MPCRKIDGCLTNSKSDDFDWRCWSARTPTYETGPCSDPINTDQGTLFLIDSPTTSISLQFSPCFLHHHVYSQPVSKLSIWRKSRVVMRERHAREGAKVSHFVAARLLPRVFSRPSPCLPLEMESLLSGFCILGIFLSTFPMTFTRRMRHLLMITFFLKTLILKKSLFLIVSTLHEYESYLLCCSIQYSIARSAVIPFVDIITKGHSPAHESGFACTSAIASCFIITFFLLPYLIQLSVRS